MLRFPRALSALAFIACCALATATEGPVGAAVVHGRGYSATVAGWTSWYGSYQLDGVGTVFCIDHGLRAPDSVLGYRPTAVGVSADVQAAMAWAVGRYGVDPSPLDAAAVMLVLHELNGAVYPFGPLDIDTAPLGGFGGDEGALRIRARQIRADAWAHRARRGPITLHVELPSHVQAGVATRATVTVRDARGAPVTAQPVELTASGGTLDRGRVVTGADGRAVANVTPTAPVEIVARTTVVEPTLRAYGPSGAPAQRVAIADRRPLTARADATLDHGRLEIHKIGDATPRFSVAGTAFRITNRSAAAGFTPIDVRVEPDGTTPTVAVPAGHYLIEEIATAPGYRRAGPWKVTVDADRTRTVELHNAIARSSLRLVKIDATTKRPLAGATLELWADLDDDGTPTQVGDALITGDEPIELTGLAPGSYTVVERIAPEGYERFAPTEVVLEPGTSIEIVLEDRRTPPPSTTTTIPPTTTTLPPTSTTTSSLPSTTTSTPTSTSPPPSSSVPETTAPPPSTNPPPTTVPAPPPTAASPPLPRTGAPARNLVELGVGLALMGSGIVVLARRRTTHRT